MRMLGVRISSNPNAVTALFDPKLTETFFPIVLLSYSYRCLIVRELVVYIIDFCYSLSNRPLFV